MAKHHMFKAEVGKHHIGNSFKGSYECDSDGNISIFWRDKLIYSSKDAIGKSFVFCASNPASAGPLKKPTNPVRRIFWELGFYKAHEQKSEELEKEFGGDLYEYFMPKDEVYRERYLNSDIRMFDVNDSGKIMAAVLKGHTSYNETLHWYWYFNWKEGELKHAKKLALLLGRPDLYGELKDNYSNDKNYILSCGNNCKECSNCKSEIDKSWVSDPKTYYYCNGLPKCAEENDEYMDFNNEKCLYCTHRHTSDGRYVWCDVISKISSKIKAPDNRKSCIEKSLMHVF